MSRFIEKYILHLHRKTNRAKKVFQKSIV